MAAKGYGEREGAAKLRQHRLHRVGGRLARFDLFGNEMRDDFGIGLALEAPAAPGERLAQRLEILDDAVVDERRSEEHTSELQSLMRISYAVFCLKKQKY